MRKALIALLAALAIGPAARAQEPFYVWCITLTLNIWDYPMFQFRSDRPTWMQTNTFRVGVGHFQSLSQCEAYIREETATNYASPDTLLFVYGYTDLQGNPQSISWTYSQLNPVPDADCTLH